MIRDLIFATEIEQIWRGTHNSIQNFRDRLGHFSDTPQNRKLLEEPHKGGLPRKHSSMIDASSLKPSQDFDELPETYVIFITENDVLGYNRPIYHIDRVIRESDRAFEDGQHIIYVNGANEDSGTELGKLMHDFRCTDPNDMYYEQLAERPRYFKETDEGARDVQWTSVSRGPNK